LFRLAASNNNNNNDYFRELLYEFDCLFTRSTHAAHATCPKMSAGPFKKFIQFVKSRCLNVFTSICAFCLVSPQFQSPPLTLYVAIIALIVVVVVATVVGGRRSCLRAPYCNIIISFHLFFQLLLRS